MNNVINWQQNMPFTHEKNKKKKKKFSVRVKLCILSFYIKLELLFNKKITLNGVPAGYVKCKCH